MFGDIIFAACVVAGYFGVQIIWGYINDVTHRGELPK